MCSSSCRPIHNITLSLELSFLHVSATVFVASTWPQLSHILLGQGNLRCYSAFSVVIYMLFATAVFFTIQMSFSTDFSLLIKLFHFEIISILNCKNGVKNSCIPFIQLPQMYTLYN